MSDEFKNNNLGIRFEYTKGDQEENKKFDFEDIYESDMTYKLTDIERTEGVVFKAYTEYDSMVNTISTFRSPSDLYKDMIEHINNIKKAEEFVKTSSKETIKDYMYYVKSSGKKSSPDFYTQLKKCSQSVKDVYASMFLGVADVCADIALKEIGVDMTVGDKDFSHIVKVNGELSGLLIASLITRSCVNYLPRLCRPMFLNLKCISEDTLVHFVDDYGIPDILKERGYEDIDCELTCDADIVSDIALVQSSAEKYQGIDDNAWFAIEYPVVLQNVLYKIDARRDFYNNMEVDVEVYDDTPANKMFKEIYNIMYACYDRIFNHDSKEEINNFEICKAALKNILHD